MSAASVLPAFIQPSRRTSAEQPTVMASSHAGAILSTRTPTANMSGASGFCFGPGFESAGAVGKAGKPDGSGTSTPLLAAGESSSRIMAIPDFLVGVCEEVRQAVGGLETQSWVVTPTLAATSFMPPGRAIFYSARRRLSLRVATGEPVSPPQ